MALAALPSWVLGTMAFSYRSFRLPPMALVPW